jgi:hypothetical protein
LSETKSCVVFGASAKTLQRIRDFSTALFCKNRSSDALKFVFTREFRKSEQTTSLSIEIVTNLSFSASKTPLFFAQNLAFSSLKISPFLRSKFLFFCF